MSDSDAQAHIKFRQDANPTSIPPFSRDFFSKDPETVAARKTYLKGLATSLVLIILAIWTVLPIYWGALWRSPYYSHNLKGWVVDFDGGQIGRTVTQTFGSISGNIQMKWEILPASNFPNGPKDLQDSVLDEKCWVAISVNPGSTNALAQAVSSADSSYNGSYAITVFASEARNENIFRSFVYPSTTSIVTTLASNFALQFTQQIANESNVGTILSDAPSIVTQPISYVFDNVRPFDVPVASALDFVGLIYLLILSFIITLFNYNLRTIATGLERRLTLGSLLRIRLMIPIVLYFFISFFYCLLSFAFQVPFNRKFGHSGFVVYWMISFCAMTALGLAIEAMITILTTRFIPFFLILWIISNVSVCFYPIEALPAIYHYGYAMPFYNVSRVVRTIVLDSKNDVGLNFGVQFAWIAVSLMTITFFQWLVRRREISEWKRKQHAGNGFI